MNDSDSDPPWAVVTIDDDGAQLRTGEAGNEGSAHYSRYTLFP